MNPESFLGTGWSFPPTFDKKAGAVNMTSDEEDVHKSLEILLTTRQGERIQLSDYGCNMDEMMFEPLTITFKTYIKDLIQTAILYHEPRIKLNDILVNDEKGSEGIILIELDYTIRSTNSRFNFVFPFYKNEGNLNK